MPSPQPARCRRCKASEGALQRPSCSLICQDPTHDCESPTLCWLLQEFPAGGARVSNPARAARQPIHDPQDYRNVRSL